QSICCRKLGASRAGPAHDGLDRPRQLPPDPVRPDVLGDHDPDVRLHRRQRRPDVARRHGRRSLAGRRQPLDPPRPLDRPDPRLGDARAHRERHLPVVVRQQVRRRELGDYERRDLRRLDQPLVVRYRALDVLRDHAPDRLAGRAVRGVQPEGGDPHDLGRPVRGGQGRRGGRLGDLPADHVSLDPAALHDPAVPVGDLGLQGLHPDLDRPPGRPGRRDRHAVDLHLPERHRRSPVRRRVRRGRRDGLDPAVRARAVHPPAAPPAGGGGMTSRRGRRLVLNVTGVVVVVLFAFPFYWMLSTAFKQPGDVQTYVPKFLPIPPTLDNFATAVTRPYFPDYVRNSVVVSVSTVLLALVVGLLAAATVSRVRFRGRKVFLLLVGVGQLAPFEALLIPMYLVFRQANLLNQIPALIITYFIFTLPFTIWALRGFIDGIPIDLEESAMFGGASRFGAFRHVVLPLLGPGLVATSIFAFITAWNEFLYAYV